MIRQQRAPADTDECKISGLQDFQPRKNAAVSGVTIHETYPEIFTKGMAAGGPLDWRISKDGMTIELPANGTDIKFGQF